MKFRHQTLIFLAGLVWLMIGAFLLCLGLRFIVQVSCNVNLSQIPGCFSVYALFSHFLSDNTQIIVLMITLALLLGHFKGKMALAKSVKRQIQRIQSLPNPANIKHLYSKGYYLLIAVMISLGVLMRFLPITIDTRGFIDTVIGAALINGALLYFRLLANEAYVKRRNVP